MDITPQPPIHQVADTWHRRLCPVNDWLVLSGDLHEDVDKAVEQIREWEEAGITHVIDVREEWSDEQLVADVAPGITYMHLPTHDHGGAQSDEWFEAGLEAARIAREHPDAKVLVHCHMGVNRGPSMGFRILLDEGVEPVQALEMIRAARPIAAVLYAEDALDHHFNGVDDQATRERLREWMEAHPIDIAGIISRINRTAHR